MINKFITINIKLIVNNIETNEISAHNGPSQ